MKKLLIAATLLLACCTSHPQMVPTPQPTGPATPCLAGDTSPDCVWPDGRPK